MLAPLPLARARTVVEFGPGTGAITRALLDALPRQATLYSFEISPRFRDYLRQKLADPRLVVISAGAECVGEELAARGGWQLNEGRIRRFTAARLLRQYFSTVAREVVLRNLPPALVFTCRR